MYLLIVVGYFMWKFGRGDVKDLWDDWREIIKYAKTQH